MAGAADTVLAIGQQQQRSLEFLGNSITNGFQQMSLAQKNRADAAEGMFKSALSYKQQQIDSYFKQKNLELKNRQLEIDSQYKQGMLDYRMQSLDQQKDYNSEVLKLRTLDDQQKFAVGSLQKSAATLSAQRLALAASMDANKNVIKELESSLMSGSGNISETELALESAKKRHSQFEEKFNLLGQQAETYGLKIAAASNGVPLSELSSLDLPSSTSSTPQNFVSVFKDDGGFPTLPTQIPSSVPFLKPSKSIKVPNDTIIPLPDISPVEEKPVEKPSNEITWSQWNKYYRFADNKNDPFVAARTAQRLDSEGKKNLEELNKSTALKYLENFGSAENHGIFEKDKDNSLLNKSMLEKSEMFGRINGNTDLIDSYRKKADLFIKRIKDKNDEVGQSVREIDPDHPDDREYDTISPVKAANAYNDFINELVNPKVVNNGNSSIFDNGIGQLYEGNLNLYVNKNKVPFRPNEELKVNFELPGYVENKAAKASTISFKDMFIKEGKFGKQRFINWAQDKSNKFTYQDFGISEKDFESGITNDFGETLSLKSKDRIKKDTEDAILELAKNPEKALEFYKKHYGK